ncbi:TPA: hypothetical protein I7730_15980 [Vibrio vulnificus]|uniref:Uncharacterized protein n=1 Tax=Vibrio vulnificus TaxID=672 RepID=A0A8H9TG42_VIBVL|nr:hypothetical protein [Vibrio vulnificus]
MSQLFVYNSGNYTSIEQAYEQGGVNSTNSAMTRDDGISSFYDMCEIEQLMHQATGNDDFKCALQYCKGVFVTLDEMQATIEKLEENEEEKKQLDWITTEGLIEICALEKMKHNSQASSSHIVFQTRNYIDACIENNIPKSSSKLRSVNWVNQELLVNDMFSDESKELKFNLSSGAVTLLSKTEIEEGRVFNPSDYHTAFFSVTSHLGIHIATLNVFKDQASVDKYNENHKDLIRFELDFESKLVTGATNFIENKSLEVHKTDIETLFDTIVKEKTHIRVDVKLHG